MTNQKIRAGVIGRGKLAEAMVYLLKKANTFAIHNDEMDVVFICQSAASINYEIFKPTWARNKIPVIFMSKGLLPNGRLVTEEYEKRFPDAPFGFMGGPMFADEIISGRSWNASLTASDRESWIKISEALGIGFHGFQGTLDSPDPDRPHDMAFDSVMKNVIVMVAGFAAMMDGDNGKALAIMAGIKFAQRAKARYSNIASLSDGLIADLFASSTYHSRNFRWGWQVGMFCLMDESTRRPPEGVMTCRAAREAEPDWPMRSHFMRCAEFIAERSRTKACLELQFLLKKTTA